MAFARTAKELPKRAVIRTDGKCDAPNRNLSFQGFSALANDAHTASSRAQLIGHTTCIKAFRRCGQARCITLFRIDKILEVLFYPSQPDGSRSGGKISKTDETSLGIGFGRPVWLSTMAQLVSPRARTARSLSRRNKYFLSELAFLIVETHVRMTSSFPANAGRR